MKTILQWFEELPDGIREKAIENYDPEYSVVSSNDLEGALLHGFSCP